MANKDDDVLIDNVKNIEERTEEEKKDLRMNKEALDRRIDHLEESAADEVADMGGDKPHLHPTNEKPTSKEKED